MSDPTVETPHPVDARRGAPAPASSATDAPDPSVGPASTGRGPSCRRRIGGIQRRCRWPEPVQAPPRFARRSEPVAQRRGRGRTPRRHDPGRRGSGRRGSHPRAPRRHFEGKPQDPAVAERALVKRPKIGDSRPAPPADAEEGGGTGSGKGRSRQGWRIRQASGSGGNGQGRAEAAGRSRARGAVVVGAGKGSGGGGRQGGGSPTPVEAIVGGAVPELDEETLDKRRGRERKGRPVGRYLMTVSVRPDGAPRSPCSRGAT